MEQVIETIVNSLVLSSMYIVVALGFALLLGIMGILNFAHGAIYMVGGYICYYLATGFGLNQWLALLVSALIMGSFGLFLEKFCFRPLGGDLYRTIIMAIALVLTLTQIVNILVGVHTLSLPAFVAGTISAGSFNLSAERLTVFVVGGILLAAVFWFITRTKPGLQMQAVAQSPEGATLQGIGIHRMSALAIAIGCALAAMGGGLLGSILSLSPFMGDYMLMKAIQLVIVSGIGSIGGVLVAGLAIGTIDATLPVFTSGAFTNMVSFGIVIIILVIRPQGLFGREA